MRFMLRGVLRGVYRDQVFFFQLQFGTSSKLQNLVVVVVVIFYGFKYPPTIVGYSPLKTSSSPLKNDKLGI